ncbi:MAG: hypothetical protein GY862_39135 [Gammaproteobacteria bacterium]|nr:hypothetical protein [Gammaproteobacteria bacterium]
MADCEIHDSVIINLGKQSRKKIKALKRGRGVLMGEVDRVIQNVKAKCKSPASGEEGKTIILPVVILYSKKKKGSKKICLRPFF